MSVDIDQRILSVAVMNDYVVTREALLSVHVGRSSINRRVGSTLTPVAYGVYVVGEVNDARLLRASLLAVEGSAAADECAGRLLGLPLRERDVTAIVAPRGRRASLPEAVRLRSTRHLPAPDIVEIDGMRVTTTERTICDLARLVPPVKTQHLIEWAVTERRMTAQGFLACARAFCRRGRTGSAVVRALSHELLDGAPLPASMLERKGSELFSTPELADFELHFVPPWSDGVSGIVDVAWPEAKLIVELDGRRWHSVTAAQNEDRRRDRVAVAHGWTVTRFGWQEVVERPSQVVAEVRHLLRTRRNTSTGAA